MRSFLEQGIGTKMTGFIEKHGLWTAAQAA
jgi:hypothetical protein